MIDIALQGAVRAVGHGVHQTGDKVRGQRNDEGLERAESSISSCTDSDIKSKINKSNIKGNDKVVLSMFNLSLLCFKTFSEYVYLQKENSDLDDIMKTCL